MPRPAARRLEALTVLTPDGISPSQADTAYYLIRDLVVTLAMPPGSPISERELMGRLSLGRTPVREGLRRLADGGLVTIWPRRGMVVSPVDARDLASISEVRRDLEGTAARLAAERATDADRARARRLLEGLGRVPDEQRSLIRLDQRVHAFVRGAARNAFLARTLEEYFVLSLRLWFLGLDRVGRLDEAVGEHRELLEAIVAGDGAAAEAGSRAHVAAFQRDIGRVLSGDDG